MLDWPAAHARLDAGSAVHDWLWLRRPEEEFNVGKIENKEDGRRGP